jgi:hypothetical protein
LSIFCRYVQNKRGSSVEVLLGVSVDVGVLVALGVIVIVAVSVAVGCGVIVGSEETGSLLPRLNAIPSTRTMPTIPKSHFLTQITPISVLAYPSHNTEKGVDFSEILYVYSNQFSYDIVQFCALYLLLLD